MTILDFIRRYRTIIYRDGYFSRLYKNNKFKNNIHIGEIIRNTHSIEKGLSLDNVRLGFGVKKIREAYGIILAYKDNGGNINSEPIKMFLDALSSYLRFHKEIDYTDDVISEVTTIYESLCNLVSLSSTIHGGTLLVDKPKYTTEEKEIFTKFINDRHSVREFDKTPVDISKLHQSIELAMRCPSACNRQCYRVHILDHKDFDIITGWLEGIGGFVDELDKLLIITGKVSMYRKEEEYQHVVTSSIFAGYLTLTLQMNEIGACVIQRNLHPNNRWELLSKQLEIPGDELPVCCIGIGSLKSQYKVPVSYRLPYDSVVTNH